MHLLIGGKQNILAKNSTSLNLTEELFSTPLALWLLPEENVEIILPLTRRISFFGFFNFKFFLFFKGRSAFILQA